jgi:anaerobic magnesium-protoporphyrin IX monomethyl ester cyclase
MLGRKLNMKVTFISPYPDITAFGIRTMSAYLKRQGHKTQMIFLPDPFGDDLVYGVKRYHDAVLDDLVTLCAGSDLIGLTLMTNFFDNAIQITTRIKEALNIPIIWGGVHPTIRPEESLEYADMVCIGDGEEAMLKLINSMETDEGSLHIDNVWMKSKGTICRNPLGKLAETLDVYPMPDYSLDGHYVLYQGHIQEMTSELLKLFLQRGTVSIYLKKIGYQTMTGRGCPHRCTYCINDTIKSLYEGQGYLRWRSVDHVIDELLWVKHHMPYVGYIWISDDAFFARSQKSLEHFCKEYSEKIRLPFSCLGSPLTITEKKMELLVDSGLIYIQVGLESGSRAIQELFNRKNMSNEIMMRAITVINRYKDKMFPPSYDFLLDVPYETDGDKIESLRFISQIPKPYHLQPFSLVLYPGTKLYQMAKSDGFIKDDRLQIYSKSYTMREPGYLNLLMTLARGGRFPGPLLSFMVNKQVVSILNSNSLKPFFRYVYLGLRRGFHFIKRRLTKQ